MSTLSGQPWRVQIMLKTTDSGGQPVERALSMAVKFEVDDGYEPPQGKVVPVTKGGLDFCDDDAGQFVDRSQLSRWQLSEDPDDRKDGLWIWGLFEEPLYPFLLMNLAFNDIVIPGGSGDDGEEDRVIPAFTAFGQIDHKADLKTGQVTLGSAPLTVKVMQRVKADLAGLATADIAENEPIGTIRFTPVS
jgi:hypothetical protein